MRSSFTAAILILANLTLSLYLIYTTSDELMQIYVLANAVILSPILYKLATSYGVKRGSGFREIRFNAALLPVTAIITGGLLLVLPVKITVEDVIGFSPHVIAVSSLGSVAAVSVLFSIILAVVMSVRGGDISIPLPMLYLYFFAAYGFVELVMIILFLAGSLEAVGGVLWGLTAASIPVLVKRRLGIILPDGLSLKIILLILLYFTPVALATPWNLLLTEHDIYPEALRALWKNLEPLDNINSPSATLSNYIAPYVGYHMFGVNPLVLYIILAPILFLWMWLTIASFLLFSRKMGVRHPSVLFLILLSDTMLLGLLAAVITNGYWNADTIVNVSFMYNVGMANDIYKSILSKDGIVIAVTLAMALALEKRDYVAAFLASIAMMWQQPVVYLVLLIPVLLLLSERKTYVTIILSTLVGLLGYLYLPTFIDEDLRFFTFILSRVAFSVYGLTLALPVSLLLLYIARGRIWWVVDRIKNYMGSVVLGILLISMYVDILNPTGLPEVIRLSLTLVSNLKYAILPWAFYLVTSGFSRDMALVVASLIPIIIFPIYFETVRYIVPIMLLLNLVFIKAVDSGIELRRIKQYGVLALGLVLVFSQPLLHNAYVIDTARNGYFSAPVYTEVVERNVNKYDMVFVDINSWMFFSGLIYQLDEEWRSVNFLRKHATQYITAAALSPDPLIARMFLGEGVFVVFKYPVEYGRHSYVLYSMNKEGLLKPITGKPVKLPPNYSYGWLYQLWSSPASGYVDYWNTEINLEDAMAQVLNHLPAFFSNGIRIKNGTVTSPAVLTQEGDKRGGVCIITVDDAVIYPGLAYVFLVGEFRLDSPRCSVLGEVDEGITPTILSLQIPLYYNTYLPEIAETDTTPVFMEYRDGGWVLRKDPNSKVIWTVLLRNLDTKPYRDLWLEAEKLIIINSTGVFADTRLESEFREGRYYMVFDFKNMYEDTPASYSYQTYIQVGKPYVVMQLPLEVSGSLTVFGGGGYFAYGLEPENIAYERYAGYSRLKILYSDGMLLWGNVIG